MKKLLAFLVLGAAQLFATANVSGKLAQPSGAAAIPGWAQLDLNNCGGNFPVVSGASITPSQQFKLLTDGTWSGTLYRNDEISCAGVTSTTWWRLTYYQNSRQVGVARDFICSQASCNFDSMTPITTYPAPTPPAQPLTGAQSVACTFTAASTWTCLNTLNTASVIVDLYDGSGNQLVKGVGSGPTSVVAVVNSVTATFASPTSGMMYVVNAGNWTPSVSSPNNIISNPTSGQSINAQPFTFNGPISSLSGVTQSQAGLFDNASMHEYFQSLLNGINLTSEYSTNAQGPGSFATDALAGGVAVPVGSVQYGSNAVAGYANTASSTSNVDAGYFQCRIIRTGGHCWGINPVVIDYPANATFTHEKMLNEFDLQPQNPPASYDTMNGLLMTLFAPASSTGLADGATFSNAFAFITAKGQPGGIWQIGYTTSDGSAGTYGLMGSLTTSANSNSQALTANIRDSGNAVRTLSMFGDLLGRWSLDAYSGKFVFEKNGSQVAIFDPSGNTGIRTYVPPDSDATLAGKNISQTWSGTQTGMTLATPSVTTPTITSGGSWTGAPSITSAALTTPTIGGGTAITAYNVFSASQTPASVNASSSAEQNFTFTGVNASDNCVLSNHPAWGNSAVATSTRTVSANTVAITFTNATAGALTPTSGTYTLTCSR